MLLEGKVAIVTGAGRGIGREEALLMAKLGAKVVVNDLGAHFDGSGNATATPAQDVVAEIKKAGGEAVANGESVTDFQGTKRILECAVDTFGHCNIIVNNAGILRDRMIFNMAEEDWDSVVAVHLKGTFNMCRHAAEYWREQHKAGSKLNGRIINTASDAGLIGNPGQSNYGACKAAVAIMAVIIGHELKKYGVTANAIAPMARTRLTTDATPATAALMQKAEDDQFDQFGPQNIAPLVAWLGSDDAAGVNGQVFRVGGRSVWPMKGWTSASRIKNDKAETWDSAALGERIKAEIAKGITKGENLAEIFTGGL
jgi:NAD(P)-dependent dehydrogenase (short-subunit alcohol dehydrogenase family)